MSTIVATTGVTTSATSTGAPVASASAGAARPPGRKRPTFGIAATIDRTSRARNPRPAAAAADPVTVLPRKVMAAQAARPSQARIAIAIQPPTGIGSNRIAV